MDRDPFVLRQNIEHFRQLLGSDLDARQRSTVEKLLAETEAKLAEASKKTKPAH